MGHPKIFGENAVNKIQIASTELATLSAKYRYNGTEENPKVDFKPVRYDYVDEGYSLFHHPSFVESRDEAVSNHSYLALTDRISFEAMAKEVKTLDPAEIVLYVTIKAPNGKYLKSVSGKLYAITEDAGDDTIFTRENVFKIYRSTGGGYLISQGMLFATVNKTMNSFTIEFKERIIGDETGERVQTFEIYRGDSNDTILLSTSMFEPWGSVFSSGEPDGSGIVRRFLSIHDHAAPADALVMPKGVYDGVQDYIVKANGIMYNERYSGIETLERVSNNYIFRVGSDYDIGKKRILLGYDGKLRWVKYHNSIFDSFFNVSTDIKDVVSAIDPNFLVEYPTKSIVVSGGQASGIMAVGAMPMNPITLKNVMTPGGNYTAEPEEL